MVDSLRILEYSKSTVNSGSIAKTVVSSSWLCTAYSMYGIYCTCVIYCHNVTMPLTVVAIFNPLSPNCTHMRLLYIQHSTVPPHFLATVKGYYLPSIRNLSRFS